MRAMLFSQKQHVLGMLYSVAFLKSSFYMYNNVKYELQ